MQMRETSRVQDKKLVINNYSRLHPHGDTSIYEALVRMSQDFQLNVPLIDGHGKKIAVLNESIK